jgi:hypothetical protein
LVKDRWAILVAARQQRPDDASILVGQRHRRHIGSPPKLKPGHPSAVRVTPALGAAQSGARAVDHDGAQVVIAALADSEPHAAIAA